LFRMTKALPRVSGFKPLDLVTGSTAGRGLAPAPGGYGARRAGRGARRRGAGH
jgi:hypothetical protein